MKKIYIIILFLIVQLSYGQAYNEWSVTYGINFATYNGDTTYYGGDGDKCIWRIKNGDKLYEYYTNGFIQSISEIKLYKTFDLIDTNKVKKTIKEYVLDGESEYYFKNIEGVVVARGRYSNNEEVGEWKYFNADGIITQKSYPMFLWKRSDYYNVEHDLIKQIDRIKTLDGVVKVREVKFSNGKEEIIYNKTLFAKIFYKFTIEYMVLFFIFMFSRVFINSRIYNRENGTNLFPIYFFVGPFATKNFGHSMLCTFTFWFYKYKPENKRLVYISNTLSAITLILFFGAIIGLAISGEI